MEPEKQTHCDCGGIIRPREDCPVLREFALLRSEQGRDALRAEYGAASARRLARTGMSKGEAAYKLQKLGVTAQTIMGLRDAVEGDALEAARKFLAQPREPRLLAPFLVLLGEPGVGKSVAAAYVLQDFVMRHRWNENATGTQLEPFLFVAAADLTSLSQFEKDDRDRIERWKRADVLVIDDAGDEGSRIGRDALIALLMNRADNCRWTVLTSNVTGEAFVTRYGKPLADRLRACAIAPKLRPGSFRKRGAA